MDCPFREDGSSCMGSIRLFAGLPESARNDLMAHALRSTHPAGSLLVREGDPIESILVVRHGRIKTFHADADGEEYLLDILHDGQAIWHGMFLKENVYRYSVGCLTHVDLCRIRRTDFMRLIGDNREVLGAAWQSSCCGATSAASARRSTSPWATSRTPWGSGRRPSAAPSARSSATAWCSASGAARSACLTTARFAGSATTRSRGPYGGCPAWRTSACIKRRSSRISLSLRHPRQKLFSVT